MRGKKTDSEFISEFISESVLQGFDTPEHISERAKLIIIEIDNQIKNIEKQKIIRSKLLDVISSFDNPSKKNKSEDAKLLSFFKIQNQNICIFICSKLKIQALKIKDLKSITHSESDLFFCVKQLIEFKVIARVGDSLLRGEKFEEYQNFLLKEFNV